MIIDMHTHCFPDKISERALKTLSHGSGGVTPEHSGNYTSLLENIRADGADKAVVLNIATNPRQQTSVNNFAISLLDVDGIIPFGSIHPDSPDALSEIERLKSAGIKGIKLHPDYQNFFVDEERMIPIYEKAAELGFVTVFHAGVDIGYPEPVHCTPERLKNILPAFGGAPVIAAHFGGWLMWKDVMRFLVGENVYFDTAYCYSRMPALFAKRIIEEHGADKILFGSDMPWSRTANEARFIKSLDLPEEQTEKILGLNAQKLLGL